MKMFLGLITVFTVLSANFAMANNEATPLEEITKVLAFTESLKAGVESGKIGEGKACYYISTLSLQPFRVYAAFLFQEPYPAEDVLKLHNTQAKLSSAVATPMKGYCGVSGQNGEPVLPQGDVHALVDQLTQYVNVLKNWKLLIE